MALLMRGHRLRVSGELRRLQASGLPDVLAVTSEARAAYLRRGGFRPIVAPLGYHPTAYGRDLGLPRDVAVGFLGDLAAPRRRRLVGQVRRDLAMRGIDVVVQTDLYGDDRTSFLSRTKVLLNILRAEQDHVGQRFLLAAANWALVVSEPIRDHGPFVPGRHFVMAGPGELADAVTFYLKHDDRRREIVERAHRLATDNLRVERVVGSIIERARSVHAAREQGVRVSR